MFWEPRGGCHDDRDGQVLLPPSTAFSVLSLSPLSSEGRNEVFVPSKSSMYKTSSGQIVFCCLECLSLILLQGLSQESWRLACEFVLPQHPSHSKEREEEVLTKDARMHCWLGWMDW